MERSVVRQMTKEIKCLTEKIEKLENDNKLLDYYKKLSVKLSELLNERLKNESV